MFLIESEKQLLEAFRPIDRKHVELLKEMRFPMVVKGYLAWSDPGNAKTFLVVADSPKTPALGVMFRKDQSPGSTVGMCEWCHGIREGTSVTLLSASVNSSKRVGVYACSDLSCRQKILDDAGPDFAQSAQLRIQKVVKKMGEFARQNLF